MYLECHDFLPSQQHLKYMGVELRDEHTLGQCGVSPGSPRLQLSIKASISTYCCEKQSKQVPPVNSNNNPRMFCTVSGVGCCYTGAPRAGGAAAGDDHPFDTGSLPLSYSGNPGVERRILQGLV